MSTNECAFTNPNKKEIHVNKLTFKVFIWIGVAHSKIYIFVPKYIYIYNEHKTRKMLKCIEQ